MSLPADAGKVVEMRGVATRFGDRIVHDDIHLDVERGEILAVVGGSGSGKTTLLREMIMLHTPDAGTVRLLGRDLGAIDAREATALRRRIGVLFQHGALFGGLTLDENVAVPLREHTDLPPALIEELVRLKIALVGLDADAGALFPSELSGGMRKRGALARALALDPEVLFLDEPTSGLDPEGADALDELVLQLQRSLGLTVVMVTHDIDTLWRIADRVVVLGAGRVLAAGPIAELAASTDPAVYHFFQGPRGRAAQAQR